MPADPMMLQEHTQPTTADTDMQDVAMDMAAWTVSATILISILVAENHEWIMIHSCQYMQVNSGFPGEIFLLLGENGRVKSFFPMRQGSTAPKLFIYPQITMDSLTQERILQFPLLSTHTTIS